MSLFLKSGITDQHYRPALVDLNRIRGTFAYFLVLILRLALTYGLQLVLHPCWD